MNPASVVASGCTCCVCVCFIVIPLWVMWRSVDGIVNDGNHWERWNATVNDPNYDCDYNPAAANGQSTLECMRSECNPTNDKKWWNLVGIAFSLLFELAAAAWIGCILVHSCKQKGLSRSLRRLCGCRTEEDSMQAHTVSTSHTISRRLDNGISVIDLDDNPQHHTVDAVAQLDSAKKSDVSVSTQQTNVDLDADGRIVRKTLPPLAPS